MADIYVLIDRGRDCEIEKRIFTSLTERASYIDDMCKRYPGSMYNRNTLTLSFPKDDKDSKIENRRMPEDIFKECAEIMGGKRHDYTAGPVHENFERSAEVSSWFKDENDKVYVTLIATKLARLATLLGNKTPRNESIRDTFKDLINYSALWADSRDGREDIAIDSIGPEYAINPTLFSKSESNQAEAVGKEIDISTTASCKIINLAAQLTSQHLIEIGDYFYQLKALRERTSKF